MPDRAGELIAANDLEGLVEWAGSLAFDECWDLLVALRDDCRAALSRGLQLWPAAAYAEYRLALDGPGPYAAAVLSSTADRFTLGPFPEVAASTHAWDELAPWLDGSPTASAFAHERVVRGEDLTRVSGLAEVYDLPRRLCEWEPAYPVAVYLPDRARFDGPPIKSHPGAFVEGAAAGKSAVASGGEAVEALRGLVPGWAGPVKAVEIDGDGSAAAAIAALGARRFRLTVLTPAEAMAWMGWAGASAGSSGRRRGAAAGRSLAWWTAAILTDLDLDDGIHPDELGAAIAEVDWYLWDDGRPATGRMLRLAVVDPEHGLAWALDASDGARPASGAPVA